MVFSSHLFIFYFLPLVLLLNYTLPFRFLSLMLVCRQLRVLRLDEPEVGAVDVHQLVHRLHLRLGAGEVFRPADGRQGAAAPAEGSAAKSRPEGRAGDLDALEHRHPLLLQVLRFRRRQPQCGAGGARIRRGDVPRAPHCPADRHLVLHVPVDELCDRRVSGRRASDAQPDRLRLFRRGVPASAGGPHHPVLEHRRAVPRAQPDLHEVRERRGLLLPRAEQENHPGQLHGARRGHARSTPAACSRPPRGTGSSPTPSRSISISRAIPTWRSAWR